MNSAWRVVDCTNLHGSLTYDRGRLVVRDRDKDTSTDVPLTDIAVLLIGLRCNCSAGLLHQCAVSMVSLL